MKREIEKYEGKEGFQRYLAWLSEAHQHYEISVSEVLHKNFSSLLSMASWSFLRNVLRLHPFESIYSRASKYFVSERLRRVFTFGSMYMGMSPFEAPGTYSLLQYTELAEGIWYPRGGFHAVVQALVNVGERLGVNYRLNTPVKHVIPSGDGRAASGVLLESGEVLHADVVVVNADLVYAYSNLFPDPVYSKSQADSLNKREGSCSSISFYWSLKQKIPELQTHNIFLADEYKESFDAIFKRQSIPSEPSFYVNVPSRIDPSAAPEGCDSIVVLVPTGHLLNSHPAKPSTSDGTANENANGHIANKQHSTIEHDVPALPEQDWDTLVTSTRTKIIDTITSRLHLPPHLVQSSITHESLNTPLSWQSTFNLSKGSILGLSHSFFNVLSFRPSLKHRSLNNCYFVGASTHPGTGVPIVLAGAKMVAEMVCEEQGLGKDVPWRVEGKEWSEVVGDSGVKQDGTTRSIDRVRLRYLWWRKYVVGLLVVVCLLWFLSRAGLLEHRGYGANLARVEL
jgi:phytoene desaturase (3,4-didehydrolycopene-forming)